MYQYLWDAETGGLLLTSEISKFSKEPRPVYYRELDILGFDAHWSYPRDDSAPIMWAEANNYIYRGRKIASTKGGSLYTKPELIIIEESPEPNGAPLIPVDVAEMCRRNADLMETLVQETIQKIYNTYMKYRERIDVFYVAFSGGKDSVVTLDLVQRALPHDQFKVLFGDTQMEFPDTYDLVNTIKEECEKSKIEFLISRSDKKPIETWREFGPPAQKMRWCCSVHKTAPQILLLRKILGKSRFTGFAFVGVRADESITRSKYEEINLGAKHRGQYDFYPILNWSSTEIYLYTFSNHLPLNDTYRKGNSRAGCLVCPSEADKNSWFKSQSYSRCDGCDRCYTTSFFHDIILDTTIAKTLPQESQKEFMDYGVWTSRHNGKKLAVQRNYYHDEYRDGIFKATIDCARSDWREWLKTIGEISIQNDHEAMIMYRGISYTLIYHQHDEKVDFVIKGLTNRQDEIYLLSLVKNVLRKSAYCIRCRVCEANCPFGYISMSEGKVSISDNCIHCQKCHSVDKGCLVASSLIIPKEKKTMDGKSVDRYKNMGIRFPWVSDYFEKADSFWADNSLGTMMVTALRAFLADAEISQADKITAFGEKLISLGVNSEAAWGLMICNLTYSSQFKWWIENIDFDIVYTEDMLKLLLDDVVASSNSKKNIISGFKYIFYTNPVLNRIGLGTCECEAKGKNLTLLSVQRSSWSTPNPEVILYSLYKFAEACGDYYQFSLSTLMDDSIDRNGISPTRIFGLDRDNMIRLLNGLSGNYPDFISASFTLDLETITLNKDKTSADVLNLF